MNLNYHLASPFKCVRYLRCFLISTFCFLGLMASGQISNEGIPRSWSESEDFSTIPVTMPSIDISLLIKEDAVNDAKQLRTPYRFAEKIPVNLNLFNSGTWVDLDNGDRIWKLNVVSNGARTINFMMDRYSLPAGAELYIYNKQKTDKIGPYTENENQENGVLGTWIVYGDDVILEYYEPRNVRGLGRISINEVSHGYRGFGSAEKSFLKLNESGACNVDVMCNPNIGATNGVDWTTIRNDYRHAVGVMIVNGSTFCTGTLMNNVREDGTPFFLTADHCLGSSTSDGRGSSFPSNNWAVGFDWFTNTPDCATFANTVGPNVPTRILSGMTLRANRGASDFALFEMNQDPPASWNLYYGGWNNSVAPSNAQLGMHHPSGDIMKLSRNDSRVTTINVQGILCWEVADWDYGVTEGGSSGSCLIDEQGRIIGQLLGGFAACTGTNDNGTEDWYGKMDVSWSAGFNAARRLSDWLDPDNTNAVTLDGNYASTLSIAGRENTGIKVVISPNPSNGKFSIDNTLGSKLSYSVYDLSGKLLSDGTLNNSSTNLDLTQYSDGMYFLRVADDGSYKTFKIIKQ